MSQPRELNCYDYATMPYEEVRAALRRDAAGLFQRATLSALARARDVGGALHAQLGPLDVGAEVHITVQEAYEEVSALGLRTTRVVLSWTAAKRAGLFPAMEATLSAYALSSGETQLDLQGRYTPPLGPVGVALDAVVGHRIAQASVLRFVQDVAKRLSDEHAGRV
jgi:hypothetical protein